MITVEDWSGRHARALREALRLSQREFAAHLGVGGRTVAKWESLGTAIRPRGEMQAALDTALAQAPAEAQHRFKQSLGSVEAARRENAAAAAARHSAAAFGAGAGTGAGAGLSFGTAVGAGSGAVSGRVPGQGRPSTAGGGRPGSDGRPSEAAQFTPPRVSGGGAKAPVTEADIVVIRSMLNALTAGDHQFGGGFARRTATEFLNEAVVPRLSSPMAAEGLREKLFFAAAEFGIRVAWMHLDTGDRVEARRIANRAFSWALDSGDLACAAWVMAMQALLETWADEPRRALAHAHAAVGLATAAPPIIGAFVHGKLARTLAVTGDRTGTVRALTTARKFFDRAEASDESAGVETIRSTYTYAYLLDEEAHCYRDLGDGRLALARTRESLQLRGPDRFTRSRAFATANQALAHVHLGEIDQACAATVDLIDLVVPLRSKRADAGLDSVFTALAPHRRLGIVTQLYEHAAAAYPGITLPIVETSQA